MKKSITKFIFVIAFIALQNNSRVQAQASVDFLGYNVKNAVGEFYNSDLSSCDQLFGNETLVYVNAGDYVPTKKTFEETPAVVVEIFQFDDCTGEYTLAYSTPDVVYLTGPNPNIVINIDNNLKYATVSATNVQVEDLFNPGVYYNVDVNMVVDASGAKSETSTNSTAHFANANIDNHLNFGDRLGTATGSVTIAGTEYVSSPSIFGSIGRSDVHQVIVFNSNGKRVSVAAPVVSAGLSVFPNPATDVTSVSFYSGEQTNYVIEVTDVTGKVMMETTGTSMIGNNKIDLNMQNYAAGMYFVNVTDNVTGRQNIKIIKQ